MKKNINIKKFLIAVMSIVMIFSTMTSCGQDVSSDNSSTVASNVDDNSETDTIDIDIDVSRGNDDLSSSSVDSSDNSSEADSSTKDSDSSEDDSSSKAESTTKKVDSSSSGDTSSKTTTKTTANTTPAVVTQPTQRTTTKVTTRSTTKTTTKATTKATTKPTVPNVSIASWDKSDPSSFIKPAGLTRLQDAVWEVSKFNYTESYNDKYLNIIREELIKYGQAYCKQKGATKYTVNPKMYPYYDKNGKPLMVPTDKNNNVIAVGSLVEFPYDEHFHGYSYFKSAKQRMDEVDGFIFAMQLYIERVICNSFRHGMEDIQWNITFGFENGITWTVMTGFPDDWK